ncbi:MAG: hypothetical protein A3G75_07005 [Verrucomicrobia bacterium RIFCSPLOWO2_12_FULL_64_8]|nr:MAG: hypothetical protein A3G75_07005 [Verrucomicrobia bacterium RIFCSPLOWO2_12_FULL_64_8]
MIGWLGDFLRFWWGLLYWNARKTHYRLRRGRVRCPCQNPSDSGRARETGCDAVQHWHEPRRFRRVCPLLIDTPDGLRCSVDFADVRPFWGRALASYAGAAAALYVAGVIVTFVVLRVVGYPVSPLTIAWPPRWPQLRLARSEYFVAKAQRALDANRVNEAMLSLDIAYQNNPRNYAVGLQLARLLSVAQPEPSNQLFTILMRDHADQRAVTAEAWFKALIGHGDFPRIAKLAAERLAADEAQRPAWTNALLIATRLSGDNQPLLDLVNAKTGTLPPDYLNIIKTELEVRKGATAEIVLTLAKPLPDSAAPFACYYQIQRLTSLGQAEAALTILDGYLRASRVGAVEAFQLRLEILATLGRTDLLRERLEGGRVSSREVELISAHLVRHPDAVVLAALWSSLGRSELPADTRSYGAYLSLFAACGAAGDWDKLQVAANKLKELTASRFDALGLVETFFRRGAGGARIENILPAMPGLPLETTYALCDRYYRAAAPAIRVPAASRP